MNVNEIHDTIADTYMKVLKRLPDREGLERYTKFLTTEKRHISELENILKTSDEYLHKGKINILKNHIDKYTIELAEAKYTMSKDLSSCAVIVEGRKMENFGTIVKMTLRYLPNDWGLMVICPLEILNHNKEQLKHVQNVVYKCIGTMRNVRDYNNLLLSLYFWDSLLDPIKHVLIFQTDSFLLRKGIHEYLKYEYIGARCKDNVTMNGGLSLRKRQSMVHILQNYKPNKYENEDIFFSRHVPKIETETIFTSSILPHSNHLGCHCEL